MHHTTSVHSLSLVERIQTQSNKIRELKDGGADSRTITKEVKDLLQLKAVYATAWTTGDMLVVKPSASPSASACSASNTGRAHGKKGEEEATGLGVGIEEEEATVLVACPDAKDPDHPQDFCCMCSDYAAAAALQEAADELI